MVSLGLSLQRPNWVSVDYGGVQPQYFPSPESLMCSRVEIFFHLLEKD